jgi:two-component system sensor histidine kinase/response regulator
VLMLSSAAQHVSSQQCEQLGIAAHLTKPVRQRELLESIRKVLGTCQAVEATPETPIARAASAPLRILLAEDNVINQRLAVRLLANWGHSVFVAGTGQLAVEAASKEHFDAVLMDVQMPEMGGFEATAVIREGEKVTGRHVPIVAMTAHAMKGDREKCIEAGMDDYISKPLAVASLTAMLERVSKMNQDGKETDEREEARIVGRR